jgi:hypothetical protein
MGSDRSRSPRKRPLWVAGPQIGLSLTELSRSGLCTAHSCGFDKVYDIMHERLLAPVRELVAGRPELLIFREAAERITHAGSWRGLNWQHCQALLAADAPFGIRVLLRSCFVASFGKSAASGSPSSSPEMVEGAWFRLTKGLGLVAGDHV